jgi:hypothetical protein
MKKALEKRWKHHKAQRKRTYARYIEKLCSKECGHILERAGDAFNRGDIDRGQKISTSFTKCKRSCYIRRSETAYTRKRAR